MSNVSELPDKVETKAPGAYRLSDGRIVRGRQGEEEYREAILGYLRRVGVHEGTLDDGREYAKIEAVIETKYGLETIGTTLRSADTGKPTLSSCLTFARGLLDCAKDELIQIEAAKSKEKNKFGSYSTYARVTRLDPITQKPHPWVDRRDEKFDYEALDAAVDELRQHPAYAEREKRSDPEQTAFFAFCDLVVKKGWPAVNLIPAAYLALASKALKTEVQSIESISDDQWAALREITEKVSKVPEIIAKAKLPETPAADEPAEYDPFADE